MTPNGKPRNALASLLALSGSSLAVAAVATAYILQNYWGMQTQWVFLHTRTHRALILSATLILLALLVKRFTRHRVARRGILLQMTSYLFLLLSATFVAQSILDIHKKLQFEPLPIDAKYKFSTDGVSANAPVWLKYLKEFAAKPAVHALEIGSFEGLRTQKEPKG